MVLGLQTGSVGGSGDGEVNETSDKGWSSRIVDRVWHKLARSTKNMTKNIKEVPKSVELVNDISYPNSYKSVLREELEIMLVNLWGEYLREMEEGSGSGANRTFSLSYKRPTAVITSTVRSSSCATFHCHHSTCSYKGTVRDLRHHYCGKHSATWNEAVMETMRYQDDMLVVSRGGGGGERGDNDEVDEMQTVKKQTKHDPITEAVISGDVSALAALLPPSSPPPHDPNILLNVSRSLDPIPILTYLLDTLSFPINARQPGSRGWGGRHLLHWTMRNRNLPLLSYLLSLPTSSGLDLDPVTDDGTGCLEYGVYGGFVEGCEAYKRKAEGVGFWGRVRGRRNKYGCNPALWAGLGKWCVEVR